MNYLAHLREHVLLSATALAIAILVGVPLGRFVARARRGRDLTLGAIGIGRVVPSLAVLALAQPVLGVGFAPSLVALALLAIPPVAINTDVALRGVPGATIDAARGLGMDDRRIDRRIAWPLALPVVFAGVRTAAVEVIASATLAAFIGGGGFGEYVLDGLASGNDGLLFLGAGSVAALALLTQGALSLVERRLRTRTA